MNTIRALIVDDEQETLELFENLLLNTKKVNIVSKLSDPYKVDCAIAKYKPDVLFLDINMNGISGLQVLENIREYNKSLPVIYVTAFDKYALEALKMQAFDYLLKPVRQVEINDTVDKLIPFIEKKSEFNKFKLPVQDGFIYLDKGEIFYVKADGNYTNIYLTSGTNYISSYNLGRLIEMLPDNNYLRLNRSVYVNPEYLHKVNRKNKTCIIKHKDSEMELHVSNTFLQNSNKLL